MDAMGDQVPAAAPNYRGLKAVVIFLGVLIVLAFGALVGGLIAGIGPRGPAGRAAEPYRTDLGVPAARIGDAQLDGNRIMVRLDNGEVLILDAGSGQILGRIVPAP